MAQSAGIPTLPWSGSNLKVPESNFLDRRPLTGSDSPPSSSRLSVVQMSQLAGVPENVYRQGCVETVNEAMKV